MIYIFRRKAYMRLKAMYKVLLVDDEYFPREALKTTIPWEEYGCTVVGEANNGLDGIEKALELEPDIILTDIDMPFMDGLDMIMKLQEIMPDVIYSIITGYSEFEYAKRGIELGVEHFILKPVKDEELTATLQKMTGLLDERHRKELEYVSLKFWAEKNTEENRKNFHRMLLMGEEDIPESQFLFECDRMDIPMKESGYGVCCLKIDSGTFVHFTQRGWQEEVKDALGRTGEGWNYTVCFLEGGRLYLIFYGISESDWNRTALHSMMQKIQIAFMQKWVCMVKAGVGGYCGTYRALAKARKEAEDKLCEMTVSKPILEMLRYIYENYANPDLSLKEIAEKLFVNYSYLSAQFTREMGMSASQYIMRFRVTKAAEALWEGGENMVEIACSAGYTDVKYFYRCFKKEFGITPYQYIDIIKASGEK